MVSAKASWRTTSRHPACYPPSPSSAVSARPRFEKNSHTIAAVESDSEGRFALDQLPAAKYQLTASKRGFRTAFYNEHDEYNSAVVTGPDQDTSSITFRLVPGAVLNRDRELANVA